MDGRRYLSGGLVGLCLGLMLGWLLWSEHEPEIPKWTGTPKGADAVLVIVVETQQNLEVVRRSVSPSRVVASSRGGLAITPQRVVVTSLEHAGELLTTAGWPDRPLEIVDIRRQSRKDDPVDQRLARIASLLNEPTLTRGEARLILDSL
jgi:hypothetical protein